MRQPPDAAWDDDGFVVLPGFLSAADLAPALADYDQHHHRDR